MQTMSITVPTGAPGELAYFTIAFDCPFEEVLENIGLLVKPSDVLNAERAGWWTVI